MRRWLHCVIVALLCLTLFVDTARACWCRRHHGRGHARQPAYHHARVAAASACVGPAGSAVVDIAWVQAPLTWHGQVAEVVVCAEILSHDVCSENGSWIDGGLVVDAMPASQCCVPCDGSAHVVWDDAAGDGHRTDVAREDGNATDIHERGTDRPGLPGEAVVVHEPTIVVGAAPPAAEPLPAAVASDQKTARPAAPEMTAREPLPDLKPTTASKEQPVAASLDLPAKSPASAADTDAKAAMADDAPMPAAADIDALAGGPRAAPVPVEPAEANLFDEFADEFWEGAADAREEMTGPDAAEEQTAAPRTPADPADEPEMTSDDAGEQAEAEDRPATKPTGDEAPAPVPEAAEAAVLVPAEPMRHWTDATGDHHAQGWLAEVRSDAVRILKLNGRYTTMARADLSDADQAYVADVATRLAAARPTAAAATDTAGL